MNKNVCFEWTLCYMMMKTISVYIPIICFFIPCAKSFIVIQEDNLERCQLHGRSHFEIPSLLSLVSIEGNWLMSLTLFGTSPIFNPDDLVMTVYTTHLFFLLRRDPSFAPLSFSFGLRNQKMLGKVKKDWEKCYLSVSIPNFKSIIFENMDTHPSIRYQYQLENLRLFYKILYHHPTPGPGI